MRYVMAKFNEKQNALMYRIFVTDMMQGTVNNTARFAGGSQANKRYSDMYKEFNRIQEEEKRTPDETIEHIGNELDKLRDEE